VEVRILKNFHMGWAVRYKMEISSTKHDAAKPNCIPGYGFTTNSNCWGGTYSLIFDLNWGMKKSHKRGVNVEIRDVQPTEHALTPTQDDSQTSIDHEEGTEDGATEVEE
jgi:hypothetical protein